MKKIFMVVKDVMVGPGYRGFSIVGLFETMSRARGCLLRMRDNVVSRFGREVTEEFSDREVRLRKDDYSCSIRICEENVGKDLSYFDRN